MTSRSTIYLALLVALGGQFSDAQDAAPPKQFSHPDRIHYDNHCLTIDGQDTVIFSGAFHYFRCPKELWRDRFRKIKEAHFNAVETYVPWNWHEQQMPSGLDDFSKIDLIDLKDWLRMAQDEFGLYTIIRPGPYICAEWNGGGFPLWLWSKAPKQSAGHPWIRSDDPTYLAWSKHWYDAVLPVIASEQVTRKPKGTKGVILVQIENEYDYFGVSSEAKTAHLKALYEEAIKEGIDVPIFSCLTRQIRGSHDPELSQVFDAANFYYNWDLGKTARDTRGVATKQPNAPVMVSELQGGWFAGMGGKLSEDQPGIESAQTNAITLTALASGATILNYYMLVGGSNFGTWGGADITQTYDYFAPIRETGGVGAKYANVQAIGAFLESCGTALARSDAITADVEPQDAKVSVSIRKAIDGRLFVFCRPTTGQTDISFKLRVNDGTVLNIHDALPASIISVLELPSGKTDSSEGKWWCRPANLRAPAAVPEGVRVARVLVRDDPGAMDWRKISSGQSLIDAGIFDVRYVTYRSQLELSGDQAKELAALVVSARDHNRLVLQVNDNIIQPKRAAGKAIFPIEGLLHEGKNDFRLLFENRGIGGFGDALNMTPGIGDMVLIKAAAKGQTLEQWRVSLVKTDGNRPEVQTGFDDSKWASVVLNEKTFTEMAEAGQPGHPGPTYPAAMILRDKNATAVYRTSIDVTEAQLNSGKLHLEVGCIDDEGEIFVNGKKVGESHTYSKPFDADISKFLNAGRNVIAVAVTNTDGPGGITAPCQMYLSAEGSSHASSAEVKLDREVSPMLTGDAKQWWSATDLSAWKPLSLNTDKKLALKNTRTEVNEPATNLMRWFHTEFELPEAKADIRVPWSAVIDAAGNGLIYLNGHALGRYADAGPQRRFYLPECWLNFGPGKKNVLTLCLRPVGSEPTLTALEITPYAEFAEHR